MNVKNLLCAFAVAGFIAPAIAHSQSLTELAKQEKQRRAKIRSSGREAKVYTDSDKTGMANAGDPSAAGTDASAAAPPSGAKKKEKTQEELSAEKQKEWSERVQKAQDEIKSLDAAIARNERGLASMYNVTPARADLAASIDSDKKKVAALRQTLASLEDERRRSGMARPR